MVWAEVLELASTLDLFPMVGLLQVVSLFLKLVDHHAQKFKAVHEMVEQEHLCQFNCLQHLHLLKVLIVVQV